MPCALVKTSEENPLYRPLSSMCISWPDSEMHKSGEKRCRDGVAPRLSHASPVIPSGHMALSAGVGLAG